MNHIERINKIQKSVNVDVMRFYEEEINRLEQRHSEKKLKEKPKFFEFAGKWVHHPAGIAMFSGSGVVSVMAITLIMTSLGSIPIPFILFSALVFMFFLILTAGLISESKDWYQELVDYREKFEKARKECIRKAAHMFAIADNIDTTNMSSAYIYYVENYTDPSYIFPKIGIDFDSLSYAELELFNIEYNNKKKEEQKLVIEAKRKHDNYMIERRKKLEIINNNKKKHKISPVLKVTEAEKWEHDFNENLNKLSKVEKNKR